MSLTCHLPLVGDLANLGKQQQSFRLLHPP
jgi:hypothetical protein